MDVRVELKRKLSAKELTLLNCGVGKDSCSPRDPQESFPTPQCKELDTTERLSLSLSKNPNDSIRNPEKGKKIWTQALLFRR